MNGKRATITVTMSILVLGLCAGCPPMAPMPGPFDGTWEYCAPVDDGVDMARAVFAGYCMRLDYIAEIYGEDSMAQLGYTLETEFRLAEPSDPEFEPDEDVLLGLNPEMTASPTLAELRAYYELDALLNDGAVGTITDEELMMYDSDLQSFLVEGFTAGVPVRIEGDVLSLGAVDFMRE